VWRLCSTANTNTNVARDAARSSVAHMFECSGDETKAEM
jgi:hypothetical protein